MRRHPDALCEKCTLNVEGSVFVPSETIQSKRIAIVGEAPGYQEGKYGKPFTGPSGKLLDMTLKASDVSRNECWTTNTCLCRPADNRTPTPTEIAACAPRLFKELEEVNPELVLALGNTASQLLLNTKEGVTRLRPGPPKDTPQGWKVIPTVHPAACLRVGDMYPSLATDVAKLGAKTHISWEPPVFRVFDDPMEAASALVELIGSSREWVVVDIEVGVDKDDFGHPERYEMLCIGLSYAPGKAIVIGENACEHPRVKYLVRTLLEDKNIIAHNGKFDAAGLEAWCGANTNLMFDTMLASYCLDERPGTNSLGYCGAEYLGAPDWKGEIDRYKNKDDSYAVIPRDVLYKYNAWDAAVTYLLFEYFTGELERYDLRKVHDMLVRASNALMQIEKDGVRIDVPTMDHLTDHYLDSLEELEAELCSVTGIPSFNPRSPQQVKAYLESIGIRVADTSADTLETLYKSGNAQAFLTLMMQQRKEQKLYGTYVKGLRKRLYQGRVHSTFLLHGTVSGRLSSRNPNLQNVPRGNVIRQMFVPEEGNVFLQGDYSQAELRVMAVLSQDEYLIDLFRDPTRDIFDEVGTVLYGPEAVGNKELRIRTKAYVYGLSYGREEYSIAQEFEIPVAEAKRGMDQFMGLIPQLNQWRQDLMHQLHVEESDLVTHFGRHRRFWLITNENRKDVEKEALSFYPQSTASDICLNALIELSNRLPEYNARLRIPVHDSLLIECPQEAAYDVAKVMQDAMQNTAAEKFSDVVPFPVEVESGSSWGSLS